MPRLIFFLQAEEAEEGQEHLPETYCEYFSTSEKRRFAARDRAS